MSSNCRAGNLLGRPFDKPAQIVMVRAVSTSAPERSFTEDHRSGKSVALVISLVLDDGADKPLVIGSNGSRQASCLVSG